MFRCTLKWLAGVLCCGLSAAVLAAPPPPWHEGFEGPDPSWRNAGGDANYHILQQQRVQGHAHSGQRCEWLQVACDNGISAYISHDVGCPRVIDELLPTVWIWSDRGNLQFAADIILPRAIDAQTGKPLQARVFGAVYNNPGHWQQLGIEQIRLLLQRQLVVMRSRLRTDVDGREAYIARVLLNVYGGRGVTNVWIDDLEIAGYVSSAPIAPGRPSRPTPVKAILPSALPVSVPGSPEPRPQPGAHLNGSVLLADAEPIFPRIIQYQGEPLPLLKQLGFNAVWLPELPAAALREESQRLGLWLVCPPPRPAPADRPGAAPPALGEFGPEFQRVLAWDLGADLIGEQLAGVKRWAEQVHAADSHQHRPLLCWPRNELRAYSRQVDLLVIDRRPLGSSLELADYGAWVRRQPARPGTPVWTTVQTQPSEGLRRQLLALQPGRPLPAAVSGDQMRLMVYTAISAGSRGLIFLSRSPLNATDPDTRRRAMDLELLNLELQLVEPWIAAGRYVATAETVRLEVQPAKRETSDSRNRPGMTGQNTDSRRDKPETAAPRAGASRPSVPGVTAAVLQMGRTRLVLPLWCTASAQCATSQATTDTVTLVVPGTPEATLAYEVLLGRLEPLRKKRGTGGIKVTLDNFGLSALVLFAQDPRDIDEVMRRSVASGKRQAELECALADQRFRTFIALMGQLARHSPPQTVVAKYLDAARKEMQACNSQLAAGQYPTAALHARQAMRAMRLLERAYWQVAVAKLGSPLASPGTASFATLPWHWSLMDRLAGSPQQPNRLPGGDFERRDVMMQTGWRHYYHPTPGIHTAADLFDEAAHRGKLGLRLTALADDPEHPPAMIETPPVWMTTPAVPVEPGQLVRIHGWVNIPLPITASVDGLLVVDSLGGDDLAERIDKTSGWREFTLYRAVSQPGALSVTFALSGLGEVCLDDVTIEVL